MQLKVIIGVKREYKFSHRDSFNWEVNVLENTIYCGKTHMLISVTIIVFWVKKKWFSFLVFRCCVLKRLRTWYVAAPLW